MKKSFGILMGLWAVSASAQSVVGDWGGKLKVPNGELRIVLHVAESDTGHTVTMDSPDQGTFGIVVDSVVYDAPQLRVRQLGTGVTISGTVSGDTIKGIFAQRGAILPLTLVRGDFALRRPQEPKPPFPYRSEEVRIENREDSVILAGTLTLPEGKGPFPAVVLVTGSGPQNRDEEISGHKPFAVIADYLTRRGIAVLRYDDRGIGQSMGDFAAGTSADFTRDALAAFDYLSTRPEVARKKIGILGHSEGGTIAFMCSAADARVAFVVSLAGCAQRGDSLLLTQNRAILTTQGAPDSSTNAYVDVLRDIFRLQERYPSEYLREHRDSLAKVLFPAGPRGSLPGPVRQNAMTILTTPPDTWLRFFQRNDPKPYIQATRCPVLALNGTKDIQVDAAINLGLVRQYAAESGNKRVITKAYDGLNHLFQHAETGAVGEYAVIEETISPEVLGDMADWILKATK